MELQIPDHIQILEFFRNLALLIVAAPSFLPKSETLPSVSF